LLEIFDSLFRCHVESARDTAGGECLGHYKDTLKPSHIMTSRTDAERWTAVHNFNPNVFAVCVALTFAKMV
jgi:hypothetical protein